MKEFSTRESDILENIIRHRRDVRGNRFLNRPIPEKELQKILSAALHAPSVGYSQPWEFVLIESEVTKSRIRQLFDAENTKGSQVFKEERKSLYHQLKLEGITEAPINLAVFYRPSEGPVLGQTSMPEVGRYSVVCAIQNMWLMARSLNIGMGWVSIIDAEQVKKVLHAPVDHELIGYLCIGYVDFFHEEPELKIKQWNTNRTLQEVLHFERFESE